MICILPLRLLSFVTRLRFVQLQLVPFPPAVSAPSLIAGSVAVAVA